jgi:hypothetical protein
VIEKARADALREHGIEPSFSPSAGRGESPPLPAHTHGGQGAPVEIREALTWAEFVLSAPTWLEDILTVPEDASPPLAMTPVHPEATGTYGPEAVEWMEFNLRERGRPLRFRWWQRLAIYRQLEHRADGSLCWRTVLESTPRRSGKSTRLRAVALWRLAVGCDLFEPDQLVLHTGKDLAIVREVLRKAWPWAESHRLDGWATKRGMTEPEVSYDETNRWVARSKDSTTGYDVCLGLVDESWDVKPEAVDDDLEPAMLERVSPQLLLTSTAHRRATSLMRGRMAAALAGEDFETLLLWWGAAPGSDYSDPLTWRDASPYWSADRAKTLAAKYQAAVEGKDDPEFDDPDPMAGFVCQYLNVWPLKERRAAKGTPLLTEDAWDALEATPTGVPSAAAIEGAWGAVSVGFAWRDGDQVIVRATEAEALADAARLVVGSGFRGRVTVGASLVDDPALRALRTAAGMGTARGAIADVARLLAEGALRHDGSSILRTQVLDVRTQPGPEGQRLVSKGRTDALKAAVWTVEAVRAKPVGKPRILVARPPVRS